MLPRLLLFVYFSFIVCEDNDVNYENLRRFMSQSPEDLAKTLQLLENPYVAAALVNGNKKQKQKSQPMEESNNLLNFLLSQRSNTKYDIENPALPLVPPVVHAKGLENDPLLGSFFQDAREDLPPLEVSEIVLYGKLWWFILTVVNIPVKRSCEITSGIPGVF